MVRSLFGFVTSVLVAAPWIAAAQDARPELEFAEPLEIVAETEKWPFAFEPETKLEPGLAPAAMGDRHAYRAAEFAIEADRYRPLGVGRSWPDRIVFGDGHFTRLYRGWAEQLDRAAERSRVLAVEHHLRAYDVLQTATSWPLVRRR